ncbi:major capsid protein [Secundilactobacillus muriivasis]
MDPIDMFSGITSAETKAFWETIQAKEAPYGLETLFPNQKQSASDVTWFRGMTNAPKPLNPSAFNVNAIPRERQGFEKVGTHTNFYKESKYIDEALRQQLLLAATSPVTSQKDIIFNKIFNDNVDLIRGAAITRELVRSQLVLGGKFSISGNDQLYEEDYEMPATHISGAKGIWGADGSTPVDDIMMAQDRIGNDTGQTISRVLMNKKTFNLLLRDNSLKSTIVPNNANTANLVLPKKDLLSYLLDEYSLSVLIDNQYYTGTDGKIHYFIPDGKAIFMPQGNLGATVFSTTPEEADLMASAAADVSITDTGVAITTTAEADPVTKVTKVSQQFIPTFEQIDSVFVLDVLNPKA